MGGRIFHWDGTEWSNVISPTPAYLYSVFMVNSTDGWAVGSAHAPTDANIIRWNGTEWMPEFPTTILTPLLTSLTIVMVTLAKTSSKKRRSPRHSCRTAFQTQQLQK